MHTSTSIHITAHPLLFNHRQPEVSHLRLIMPPQQDVVALQVAVNDRVVMTLQVLHALRDLQRELNTYPPE